MYYGVVLGFMLVLPLVSTIGEAMTVADGNIWLLALKWFVFWGVGARLAIAGVRQIAQPAFTARDIFEIDDPKASKIVQELGFWNFAGGVIALLSLVFPGWAMPAAVAGGLFYGLAGWQHWRNGDRNTNENVAMTSDLFMFAVLLVLVIKLLAFP
jgi:hypothetical protein